MEITRRGNFSENLRQRIMPRAVKGCAYLTRQVRVAVAWRYNWNPWWEVFQILGIRLD